MCIKCYEFGRLFNRSCEGIIMNKFKNIIEYIKNGDLTYHICSKILNKTTCKRSFTRNYDFINRKNDTDELIIILAGFQPYYWDILMQNIYNANKVDKMDVYVCIPHGGRINIYMK